ncbi:UNVERIFIED_CONTAM: Acyl transferase 5 [Sesamum radiatum]|uniref:Acyl transferase 5 n=1 Tax=Sesamum radiatum TaxID=300843 RepID=A0AAW2W3U1_SESRA
MVAAVLWRQRTCAIEVEDERQVRLVFFANCRQLVVEPPLPKGFYGNCFFPVSVTMESGRLRSCKTVFQVVKLIQEAKAGLPSQFAEWINNNKEGKGKSLIRSGLPLSTAHCSYRSGGGWGLTRLIMGGEGPPHCPNTGLHCYPGCHNLSPPAVGVRLMTWCVQHQHLQPLLQHMNHYII